MNQKSELSINKYLAKLTGRSDVSTIAVNIRDDGQVKKLQYSQKAFITFVNKWQQVNLIGYIENMSTRFVLFQPKINDEVIMPIQAVTFAISGEDKTKDLIYGSHWEDGYLFFYNDIFMNELHRVLNNVD